MSPKSPDSYKLQTTPTVRRQLAEDLPEAVAAAALEFITGPLLESPYRVGRQLSPPLDDRYGARRGTYRVLYRIDDHARTLTVVLVTHRRDAYRPR
jgi:mRNA interferase RelE/StbE